MHVGGDDGLGRAVRVEYRYPGLLPPQCHRARRHPVAAHHHQAQRQIRPGPPLQRVGDDVPVPGRQVGHGHPLAGPEAEHLGHAEPLGADHDGRTEHQVTEYLLDRGVRVDG